MKTRKFSAHQVICSALVALNCSVIPARANTQSILRYHDCIYNPFRLDGKGNLVSTYSCDNSDIVSWGIALNCVNIQRNLMVPDLRRTSPDKMPGSDGAPMKWKGWESVKDTEHEKLFWRVCRKYYK